jgi:hypothetical protein
MSLDIVVICCYDMVLGPAGTIRENPSFKHPVFPSFEWFPTLNPGHVTVFIILIESPLNMEKIL